MDGESGICGWVFILRIVDWGLELGFGITIRDWDWGLVSRFGYFSIFKINCVLFMQNSLVFLIVISSSRCDSVTNSVCVFVQLCVCTFVRTCVRVFALLPSCVCLE